MGNERFNRALRAMEAIGLSTSVVSPVLKHLLKLYGNEWELIEAENYRVLADAVFESQDEEEKEPKKQPKRQRKPDYINVVESDDESDVVVTRVVHRGKNLGFDPKVMACRIPSNHQNLTRVQYELSQTYGGDDDPAEFHFRMAESQFFRMSRRNDYKVIKVEHILNKMLQERYENAKKEFERRKKSVQEMLVFHGTNKDAIEKIIEEGFKIGGRGVAVRNGRAYGEGVYTALDPNISIPYSKGGGMILLSSALVGKKDMDYKEGGSSSVLVLQKSEYLLPKYIVHYTK